MSRADKLAHPLTASLENVRKVYVELEPAPMRRSGYRKPVWRARDRQWAVQDQGCPQFLAANEGGVDRYRVWTSAEYKAWESANG